MPSLIPKVAEFALRSVARSNLNAQLVRRQVVLRDVGDVANRLNPHFVRLFVARSNQSALLVKRLLAEKGAGAAASLFCPSPSPSPNQDHALQFVARKSPYVLLERLQQGVKSVGDVVSPSKGPRH